MTSKIIRKLTLFTSVLFFSLTNSIFAAEDTRSITIPKLANAQVFANLSDSIPAVLNYFTLATEEQVLTFYQLHFGDPSSQSRKRGRLTLTYQNQQYNIRVVISQQDNKRQVDVMVNK